MSLRRLRHRAQSQSVRVDQHPTETLLLQPPVGEVLREPARGALRRQILHGRGVDERDAELRFDRVYEAAYGIGMDLRGNTKGLESSLDVLVRRLDQNGLPRESGEPTARSQELPPVGTVHATRSGRLLRSNASRFSMPITV